MRLFIALPVNRSVGRALDEAQAALQRQGVRGRFTPPENRHMTLVFLGNVRDPAPVIEALRQVPLPRAALTFDRLTLFGDTLVALYRPNEKLSRYVRALREALDAAGVRYDRQSFRPHVTLCRKTALPRPDLRFGKGEQPLRETRLTVTRALLLRSDLSGDKPKYTTILSKGSER